MQECNHDLKILTLRTISSGTKHYQFQCAICKRSIGNFIGKETAEQMISNGEKLEPFDQKGLDRELKKERERYELSQQEQEQAQRDRKTEWWENYKKYLKSNEWTMKRNAVFYRSGGICECCLKNRATQVHHLSYKNVGHEFLPELTATCDECHKSAHEEMAE